MVEKLQMALKAAMEDPEYLKTAQYGAAAGYVAATLFGAALTFAAGSLLAHVVIAQAGVKGN